GGVIEKYTLNLKLPGVESNKGTASASTLPRFPYTMAYCAGRPGRTAVRPTTSANNFVAEVASTVNASGNVMDALFWFDTTRFHTPGVAPLRLNDADTEAPPSSKVVREPGISGWPLRWSTTLVDSL